MSRSIPRELKLPGGRFGEPSRRQQKARPLPAHLHGLAVTHGNRALSYAVRPLAVAKYLGQLAFAPGLLTAVPMAASLYSGEHAIGLRYAGVMGLLLLMAGLSRRLVWRANESFSVVADTFRRYVLSEGREMLPDALAHWEPINARNCRPGSPAERMFGAGWC